MKIFQEQLWSQPNTADQFVLADKFFGDQLFF